jgi:hypothetical protein
MFKNNAFTLIRTVVYHYVQEKLYDMYIYPELRTHNSRIPGMCEMWHCATRGMKSALFRLFLVYHADTE